MFLKCVIIVKCDMKVIRDFWFLIYSFVIVVLRGLVKVKVELFW